MIEKISNMSTFERLLFFVLVISLAFTVYKFGLLIYNLKMRKQLLNGIKNRLVVVLCPIKMDDPFKQAIIDSLQGLSNSPIKKDTKTNYIFIKNSIPDLIFSKEDLDNILKEKYTLLSSPLSEDFTINVFIPIEYRR